MANTGLSHSVSLDYLQNISTNLVLHARADSTIRNYGYYQKAFLAFLNQLGRELPASYSVVASFLTSHFLKTSSHSGCKQAKFAIAALHKDAGFEDPSNNYYIKQLLASFKKYGNTPKLIDRQPFPLQLLKELASYCPAEWSHLRWCQSVFLCILGLRTMSRGSELAGLKWTDFLLENKRLQVIFRKTKTKTHGRVVWIEATGSLLCPIKWFLQFASCRPENFEFCFGEVSTGKQLSPASISVELQSIAKIFDCQARFTSHSLRIGGASEAVFAGFSKEAIQAIGDWSSNAIDRYFRQTLDTSRNISKELGL
jgi:integrase